MDSKTSLNTDYGSASKKRKTEVVKTSKNKKVNRVTKGPVKVKQKSEFRKFADAFIGEDIPNLKDFIVKDIVIPAIRKTLWDITTGSADMFFGNGRNNKNGRRIDTVSYRRDYNSISYGGRNIGNRDSAKPTFDYKNIFLATKDEAVDVLTQLDELLDQYDVVSINDYYDTVGVTGDPTACNYGWKNLDSAHVIRTRDGWAVSLPRAMPID